MNGKIVLTVIALFVSSLSMAQINLLPGEAFTIMAAPHICGNVSSNTEITLQENESVTLTVLPFEECPPVPEDVWLTYNDHINPNSMQFDVDAQEWFIDVEAAGTIWYNDARGEGHEREQLVLIGDTVTIPGLFIEGPNFPVDWGSVFSFVLIMQDDNNWEFLALGNRPSSGPVNVTLEHKITVNDRSIVGDQGTLSHLSPVNNRSQTDVRVTILNSGLRWEYYDGFVWTEITPLWRPSSIDCSAGCRLMLGGYGTNNWGKGLPFTAGAGNPF